MSADARFRSDDSSSQVAAWFEGPFSPSEIRSPGPAHEEGDCLDVKGLREHINWLSEDQVIP